MKFRWHRFPHSWDNYDGEGELEQSDLGTALSGTFLLLRCSNAIWILSRKSAVHRPLMHGRVSKRVSICHNIYLMECHFSFKKRG